MKIHLNLVEKLNIKFLKNYFFGRINEIKNIDLIIKSFIESKPSKEWSLELYGIQDDAKYLNYLKILLIIVNTIIKFF